MSIYGFDERLANARREKSLTQEELAARLGVTPQAVSKWERSTGYPDIVLFSSICEILDCSMDFLLNGKQPEVKISENEDEGVRKQLLRNLIAEPLTVEVGGGLIDLLMKEKEDGFKGVSDLRDKLALKYGVLLPLLRLRDGVDIGKFEYRILAYDKVLAGYTFESAGEISFERIMNHLGEICLQDYGKIINRQIVKTLVDNLEEQYPAVVQGVIPEKITLMQLQAILSRIVEKGGSVHNIIKIIEILEQETDKTKISEELVESVINHINEKS